MMTGVAMLYSFNTFGKCMLGCGLVIATFAQFDAADADSFSVLYAFKGGSDGALPQASLLEDGARNLDGTTLYGGSGNDVVFELAPDGQRGKSLRNGTIRNR
jgi:hypothetical protein